MTTIRELRTILFDINDQGMTVKALRDLLFNVDNQDQTIERGTLADIEAVDDQIPANDREDSEHWQEYHETRAN